MCRTARDFIFIQAIFRPSRLRYRRRRDRAWDRITLGRSLNTANALNNGLTVDYSGLATGNPTVATFRRDPRATDLTYELQAGSDLTS